MILKPTRGHFPNVVINKIFLLQPLSLWGTFQRVIHINKIYICRGNQKHELQQFKKKGLLAGVTSLDMIMSLIILFIGNMFSSTLRMWFILSGLFSCIISLVSTP